MGGLFSWFSEAKPADAAPAEYAGDEAFYQGGRRRRAANAAKAAKAAKKTLRAARSRSRAAKDR
jgi:hypothetical protein